MILKQREETAVVQRWSWCLLQESRLVFGLVVVTKLNLALITCKLAGFVEGDGMRTVQDVITGLQN